MKEVVILKSRLKTFNLSHLWNIVPMLAGYLNIGAILFLRGNAGGFDHWIKTTIIAASLSGPFNYWILNEFKKRKTIFIEEQLDLIAGIIPSYFMAVTVLSSIVYPLELPFLGLSLIAALGYSFAFFALIGISDLWQRHVFIKSASAAATFSISQTLLVITFTSTRIEVLAALSCAIGGLSYLFASSYFARIPFPFFRIKIKSFRKKPFFDPLLNPTTWVVERSSVDQHFVFLRTPPGHATFFYFASRLISTFWNWASAFRIPLIFSRQISQVSFYTPITKRIILSSGVALLTAALNEVFKPIHGQSETISLVLIFYSVTVMSSFALSSMGTHISRPYSIFNLLWFSDLLIRLIGLRFFSEAFYVYTTLSLASLQWIAFIAEYSNAIYGRCLSIYIFHPTILHKGMEKVKPHHGKFIESIAKNFDRVNLIAPFWKPHQFPAWLNPEKPIYNYRIQSKEMHYVRGFSSKITYPLRFFQQIRYAITSDFSFFFTPAISSIFLAPILLILNKRYFCYVAIDPTRFYSDRFKFPPLAKAITRAQIWVGKKSSGILATGARNLSYWKDHPNIVRVSPLLDLNLKEAPDLSLHVKVKNQFAYVGLITKRKRVDLLIKAIFELRKQGISATLKIAGSYSEEAFPTQQEQKYYNEVRFLVDQSPHRDSIEFMGYISEPTTLQKLYATSEFLALFSEFEGFPKVVYEAMAYGAVPVLSRLDSYSGILEDQQNAIFIDEPMLENFTQRFNALTPGDLDQIKRNNLDFLREIITISPGNQFEKMLGKINENTHS